MADKDIKEGDEVSWNWGGGEPTGVAAEIKTHGKLEIESKGKQVHKNADPENPAVHVEREGNDVVKRASELTKLTDSGGSDKDAEGEEEPVPDSTKENGTQGAESIGEVTGEAEETVKEGAKSTANGKRKKSDASAKAGDKRAHDLTGSEHEEDQLEEETPKPTKKAKTTKKGTRGGGRGRGRGRGRGGKTAQPEETSVAAEKEKDAVEKMTVDETKERDGGGKVAVEISDAPTMNDQHPQAAVEAAGNEAPAANTRSQD